MKYKVSITLLMELEPVCTYIRQTRLFILQFGALKGEEESGKVIVEILDIFKKGIIPTFWFYSKAKRSSI